jgi:hypothetical protein
MGEVINEYKNVRELMEIKLLFFIYKLKLLEFCNNPNRYFLSLFLI